MTGYPVFRHRLWTGLRSLSTLLRGPSAAAGMIAGSVGVVLMVIPAGAAWSISSVADALASAAILDWVKGSLGLMLMLRRLLAKTNGD